MNLPGEEQPRSKQCLSATSSGSWDTDPTDVAPNITEELQGLAAKGLTAPLARRSHPQQGEEEANVHLLQTVWCRYLGQAISQPTNIWSAVLSNLAAAQALDQHQQDLRQQPPQAQQPRTASHLNVQHPAHLVTKDLIHDELHSLRPASTADYAVSPPVAAGQDVWARAASLQSSHMSYNSAQQELAGLLRVSHVDGTAEIHQDQSLNHQSNSNWAHPAVHADAHALQQPQPVSNAHGRTTLSPSPSAELTQSLSWNQLNSPHKGDKQQQQQPTHLPCDAVGTSPGSPLGNAYRNAWWAQQSSEPGLKLDAYDGNPDPKLLSHQEGTRHTTMLGMGQYAMEAAAPPSYQSAPKQEQHEAPQWLQAMHMDTARAVRPGHFSQQHFPHPSEVLKPSFQRSGSYPAQEDSGDLSTSIGTLMFLGRACSVAPGMTRAHDTLLPGAASPKSSLDSSLPTLSLAQLAQGDVSRVPPRGPGPSLPSPAKLLMQLVAAPSSFSAPLSTGKLLSPPFRVRVAMLSEVPTKLPLLLRAYVLSKDNLNSLERWHPEQHIVTEGVTGGEVQQTVLCTEGSTGQAGAGEGDAAGLLGGVTDFVFRDLRFTTSSRMKPRWLVIAAVLPTQDVMYVQYNVPTIVMSRACDQLTKAMGILKGVDQGSGVGLGVGPRKRHRSSSSDTPAMASSQTTCLKTEDVSKHASPTLRSACLAADQHEDDGLDWPTSGAFTFSRWHALVEKKYNAYNLVRPLGSDDLHMMEQVAGFIQQGHDTCIVSELNSHQWAFFGAWYLSYLKIFRCHQQLWIMQSPVVICGFGVDRQRAEQLLADQPVGTFLVRPGLSLADCMIISAVIPGGQCKHMALDGSQLGSRCLEVWVRDVLEAQQVLDHRTGQRYAKAEVFPLYYQRFGAVSDVFGHQASQCQLAGRP